MSQEPQQPQQKQTTVEEALTKLTAKSPIFPNNFGRVVETFDDATIPEVFHRLIKNRIQCMPVLQRNTGKVLRLVSLADILAHLLHMISLKDLKEHKFQSLLKKQEELGKEKIMHMQDSVEKTLQLPEDVTIFHCAQEMIAHRVHRVLITNKQGECINLITQSRIMKLIAVMMDAIPAAKKTVQELGLIHGHVITVHEKDTVYEAFKKIISEKVSAVGVVDENGAITGSVSISDVKQLGYEMKYFDLLESSCADYLKTLRIYDSSRPIPPADDPVCLKESDTLETVVKKINYYSIHRVYIVDNNRKPIGVVSIYDVLKACLKH